MLAFTCRFCGTPGPTDSPLCLRCGAELDEPAAGRVLLRIRTARTVLRTGGDVPVTDLLGAVGADLTADPSLRQSCARALEGLGDDAAVAFDDGVELGRMVATAGAVLAVLPPTAARAFRRHVANHRALLNALREADGAWRAVPPAARKVRAWFEALTDRLEVDAGGVRASIYATPDQWPAVAAALDPPAFAAARPRFLAAAGAAALAAGDHATARDRYEAALAAAPAAVPVLAGLARTAAAAGERAAALRYCREAVGTGTREAAVFNRLAWYLCTLGDPTPAEAGEAVWAARRATDEAPVAAFWDTLAEALERFGDLTGAVAAARQAARLVPARSVYTLRACRLAARLPARPSPGATAQGETGLRPSSLQLRTDRDTYCDLAEVDSDSEFELTLDDCSSAAAPLDDEEGDIFETDFELPALLESDSVEIETDDSALDLCLFPDDASDPLSGVLPRATVPPGAPAPVPTPQTEPLRPVTDKVHFSVTAPETLRPGWAYALDVWAHLAADRAEVLDRAREANRGDAIHVRTKGGVGVARGTALTVRLRADGFEVADPEDVIVWDGDIGNATFPVRVPPAAAPGSHAGLVTVFAGGLAVAKVHFDLLVGAGGGRVGAVPAREVRHRRAFASYASPDRDAVLARVQGIQKALPDLDVFLDVAALRSGERWADRLSQEVTGRDVFYLFWSAPARASEWVGREWRLALAARGVDYIDPVPLAPPDEVPPPPELAAHLHFNDWVLAYLRGGGAPPTG